MADDLDSFIVHVFQDLLCLVRRSVIDNNKFVISERLEQDALYGPANKLGAIVGWNDYTYFGHSDNLKTSIQVGTCILRKEINSCVNCP